MCIRDRDTNFSLPGLSLLRIPDQTPREEDDIMYERPKLLLLSILTATAVAAPVLAAPPPKNAPKKEPAAVLAVVSGNVNVLRGEAKLDGSFGAALQPGDVVETTAGAQAAVLFDSGQIIELGPGSRITIGSVPAKGGDSPSMAQIPDALSGSLNRFARSSEGAEGMSVAPDLRGGGTGDKPDPLSPRNTRVAPGSVVFAWSPVEDVLEYHVHLTGPGKAAGTYTSTTASWTAPKDGFASGQRWTWSVEAVTQDGGLRSDEVAFEIASAEQWNEITALTSRLDPLVSSGDPTRKDTAAYLLGSYCRSAGFYGDAISQLEGLAQRHPDRKELHQELGSLYQAIGRNDKAAEEYKLALKN